jgi:hypothetical protein
MAEETKSECAWVYIGMPFRVTEEQYASFEYKDLPKVETTDFDHLESLKDVETNKKALTKRLYSPSGCSIAVDVKSGQFYQDPQGRLVWYFSDSLGVFVVVDAKKITVAKTLPEFFARVDMENSISRSKTGLWLRQRTLELVQGDETPVADAINDMDLHMPAGKETGTVMWNILKTDLTKEQIGYLQPYFNAFAK